MGLLDDLMKQAHGDLGKVVDAVQEARKRFTAKCSTCNDTGMVTTAKGTRRCACEAGRTVDEKRRLPR